MSELEDLEREIVECRRCPRLVAWREEVAETKRAAFADEEYWGRPIPGFGDPQATVMVLGLAPAAHGGNRTGRVFTGDRSGDWLFAALHRAGMANQPLSRSRDDGLRLTGCWVSAAVRCAPPANKPTPAERDNCLPYAVRELALLRHARVIVCLGGFAWDAALRVMRLRGGAVPRPASALRPRRRGAGRRADADRLLSPQPAEHVHRQADRADDRRRARAGAGARGVRVELAALAIADPPERWRALGFAVDDRDRVVLATSSWRSGGARPRDHRVDAAACVVRR